MSRSPSRGLNMYVYEPQQNLGRGLWPRQIGLSTPPPTHTQSFITVTTDRSKATLLLWFILIVTVRPLPVNSV